LKKTSKSIPYVAGASIPATPITNSFPDKVCCSKAQKQSMDVGADEGNRHYDDPLSNFQEESKQQAYKLTNCGVEVLRHTPA
jgi:hypothetical protein